MRNAKLGSVLAAGLVVMLIAPSLATAQQARPRTAFSGRPDGRCHYAPEDANAVSEAAKAINAALRTLPAGRSTAEDIEATILFTLSQRDLPAGVAKAAIDQVGGGSAAMREAIAHVRVSLLRDCGVGTAGLAGSSFGGPSGSFFSAPIIGIGGGSATYTQ